MPRHLLKPLLAVFAALSLFAGCDKLTSASTGGESGRPPESKADTTGKSGDTGRIVNALEGVWVRSTGTSTETVTLSAGGAARFDSVAIVGASTRWIRYEGTWTGTGNTGSIVWTSVSTSADGATWSARQAMSDGSYSIVVNGNVGTATVHGVKREYTKGTAPVTTPDPVAELVAPVFSVPTGTYSAAQTVALQTATIGGTIRYTTDGTTPTASSLLYGAPIVVPSTRTLKAVTVKDGKTSSVASVTITIDGGSQPGKMDTALVHAWINFGTGSIVYQGYSFSPDGQVARFSESGTGYEVVTGTYTTSAGSLAITWLDARKGVDPSSLSPTTVPSPTTATYSVSRGELSLTISGKTTVYDLETEGGEDPVEIVVDEPVISPAGGTFSVPQTVTLKAQTGATIYYTTNGTMPTTSSTRYTGPIKVSSSQSIVAIAVLDGVESSPAIASFAIQAGMTFDPKLVGSWRFVDSTDEGGFVFGADGKVEVVAQGDPAEDEYLYSKIVGSYSTSGSTLTLTLSGRFQTNDLSDWGIAQVFTTQESFDLTYSFTGSQLVLQSETSNGTEKIGPMSKVASLF